jgi:hypothetical protein
MNARTDLTELLDAYLADGADVLPDRVIEAALETIDRTDQRSAVRRPQRRQIVSQPLRFAAAAVIAVAVLGSLVVLTGSPRPPAASGVVGSLPPSVLPSIAIASQSGAPSSSQPAARPAAWTSAGAMASPRFLMTATLLEDGRVLVAGGRTTAAGGAVRSPTLGSAEIYDPAANRWMQTAPMSASRVGHTATLLTDGRVLVVGGYDDFEALATAEIYDPAAARWSPTGSLTEGRGFHTATRLADGRVLVAGGRSNDSSTGHAIGSSEIYDPATGRWTLAGPLSDRHFGHSAISLADGRVLIAGTSWTAYKTRPSSRGDVFDPSTGQWTATGPMIEKRSWNVAALLDGGRVVVAGGGGTGTAEIYDVAANRWQQTGSMAVAHRNGTGSLLRDGRVLVVGGESGASTTGAGTNVASTGAAIAEAELFDPANDAWTPTVGLATPRDLAACVVLADGSVLVIGGSNGGVGIASAERFDPGVAE